MLKKITLALVCAALAAPFWMTLVKVTVMLNGLVK